MGIQREILREVCAREGLTASDISRETHFPEFAIQGWIDGTIPVSTEEMFVVASQFPAFLGETEKKVREEIKRRRSK